MSKVTIPLSFHDYVDVDAHTVENGLKSAQSPGQESPSISEAEIIVEEEPLTKKLKEKLSNRVKNFANDPYYSPELSEHLIQDIDALKRFEHGMLKGVSLLANNYGKPDADFNIDVSLHWFCKLMRSKIMYVLWMTQIPRDKNPDLIDFDKKVLLKWNSAYLMSNTMAEEFFETDKPQRLVIGNEGLGYGGIDDFSFWVDGNLGGVKDLLKYQLPENAKNILSKNDFSKFVIPQMLAYVEPKNHIWSLKDKVLAIP